MQSLNPPPSRIIEPSVSNVCTLPDRVLSPAARGAQLLDAVVGSGWAEDIDAGRLDLGSPGMCVLGQLFGDYADGVIALGLGPMPTELGFIWGYDAANRYEGQIAHLNLAWREEIARRRMPVLAHVAAMRSVNS